MPSCPRANNPVFPLDFACSLRLWPARATTPGLFMNKRFQGSGRRWAPWVAALLCSSAEARAQAPEPPPPSSSVYLVQPVVVKRPLSWAGTNFEWGTQLSTTILGIGPDYNGTEDERVFMTWSLSPTYFIVQRPRHQLSVGTRLAVSVELTSSDTTDLKQEPRLGDIPIGLDYAATLFTRGDGPTIGGVSAMRDPTLLGEGDWRTWALVSSYLVLPASAASRAAGVDLGTSIGAGIRQQIKLLGGESGWLSYLLITASERWTHAFTSAPSGETGGPRRTVDRGYGSGAAVLPDSLRHSLSFTLPIYRELQLDTTLALRHGFPASLEPIAVCVQTMTGCVSHSPVNPSFVQTSTVFSVGFSYEIIPELGLALGYVNDSSQIGEDGMKKSLFYSVDARFYTSVTFSFDRLYQRLAAPAPAPAGPPL